jgi:hypothetical protein
MTFEQLKLFLEEHRIRADAVHIQATAATVTALVKNTAERFAKLPLEAEPPGFAAEQSRRTR